MTVAQAMTYYEIENYYQQNNELGSVHGKGLKYLGIKDGSLLNENLFRSLLVAHHPETGEVLLKNSGNDRRAGFDVTTSAPKSVSLLDALARVNGREDISDHLRAAHESATQKMMQKIQNNYAYTRIADPDRPGKTIRVKTNGMMWVNFTHDITRSTQGGIVDPQLHTHNFIFNLVSYTDPITGETRTLTLSNEEIFKQKMYLGQYYRSELAQELKKLGYEIVMTDARNGFFEIKGIDEEFLKIFSGRSEEIKEHIDEYKKKYKEASDAKLKNIINQDIKAKKKTIDAEALLEQYKERMNEIGLDTKFVEDLERNRESVLEKGLPVLSEELVQDHINKSLLYMTETESVFTKEQFMRECLKHGLEDGISELDYDFALLNNKNIVSLGEGKFSTHEMIEAEKGIIKNILTTQNKLEKIADIEKVNEFMMEHYKTLTEGQLQMVQAALSSKDQFVAVQGNAGTGKTFAAAAIKRFMDENVSDMEIVGASFMGKAAAGLEADAGILSSTLHSYLAKEALNNESRNKQRVLIIDEAGLTGAKQLYDLMQNAMKHNDKIIFIGDTKQFASISAGTAFYDMQRFGIHTINMTESKRQEKGSIEETVVQKITEKQVGDALTVLDQNQKLLEIENAEDRMQTVIDSYLSMDDKNRKNTICLVTTNKERRYGNQEFRNALGLRGNKLYKTKETISVRGIERYLSRTYKSGMSIAVGEHGRGFKKGEVVEVTGAKDKFVLIVKTKAGIEKELDLSYLGDKSIAYNNIEKDFTVGDKIVYTKNIHDKNSGFRVQNGDSDTIKSIDDDGNVNTEGGEKFNINRMEYIDHAFVITDIKSQGMTSQNVFVLADSQRANLKSLYVQLSRVKNKLIVLTDNKEALIKNAGEDRMKTSTLDYTKEEVLAEVAEINAKLKSILQEGNENESRTRADAEANIEGSIRHDQQTDRDREAIIRDISDISRDVRRAIRGISTHGIAGDNFIKTRQSARQIEDYKVAVEINELKRDLPPHKVLEALDLDVNQYAIHKHEDGFWRIQHENRSFNTSDFLTKHLHKTWPEAKEIMLKAYADYKLQQIADSTIEKSQHRIASEQQIEQIKETAKTNKAIIKESSKEHIGTFLPDSWKIDRAKTSINYAVMKNAESGERIIISKGNDEKYHYFNPQNEHDRGTVVDFMKNRGILDLQAQADFVSKRSREIEPLQVAGHSYQVDQHLTKYNLMSKVEEYNKYLSEDRGISQTIYNAYSNQIRVDDKNNIITPMYAHTENIKFAFSGYNAKLSTYYAPRGEQIKDLSYGQKSITALKPQNKKYSSVVIAESAIDGMSYVELKKLNPRDTMIISLNGQTSVKAKELAAELAEGKNTIIAVDNDKAGQKFMDQLLEKIPNAKVDIPITGKDFNDELKAQKVQQQIIMEQQLQEQLRKQAEQTRMR